MGWWECVAQVGPRSGVGEGKGVRPGGGGGGCEALQTQVGQQKGVQRTS